MRMAAYQWGSTAILASIVSVALGQVPASPPQFDPVAMRRDFEAYEKMPDSVGTGKYPAIKQVVASLPDHVVYEPKDLSALGAAKLGVVAWGMAAAPPTAPVRACTWKKSPLTGIWS